MDISDVTRGPIVEREELKADFESKGNEIGEEIVDDEKSWSSNGDRCSRSLKRSLDENSMNSKKRRKQLKPIKIATNLEDMVKVPKQIIGLNNDLGNVDDLSHTVPKELSSKSQNSPLLTDVQFTNPIQLETSAGQKWNSVSRIDSSRVSDKPEVADLNVPSIEMGPNYITNPHFIFPLSFQPVKSTSFWSEANLKIFNQEAYCELCKKEFCNKYFLKTHKANKHGIYVDVPASSATKVQAKVESKDANKIGENGRISGDGDCTTAFCDLCNKKFCNKYFVRRHKSKSHGLLDEEAHGLPTHETESKIVQNASNNSTKETDSTLNAQEPLALVSRENDQDNQKRENAEDEQDSPLNLIVHAKDVVDDEKNEIKAEENPDDDGDECSSENIEKLQTMLLRLNPSEVESKACRVCNETVDCSAEHKCPFDKKDKEYLSEGNDSSSDSKVEYGVPKVENHDYTYLNKLDHLKQMKPTSSYCEICNKELCNKYFMRTHMQRMHGIEIEHGTQIGGVVCNICNKELCSKYFLRVHKQNTHGIISPNSLLGPSTSGNVSLQRSDTKPSRGDSKFSNNFTQMCYICNKRFRSPKWLQAHFVSDHREEAIKMESKELLEGDAKEEESVLKVPKNNKTTSSRDPNEPSGNCFGSPDNPPEGLDVISKIFWENNAASKMYNCSQCPFTTSVLAFLFVHERSHFVLPQDQAEVVKPSPSLQNLIHDKTFWQHKITQQIPECLDLSASKPKYVSLEQNGS